MSAVLDASAVLAFLRKEPGHRRVADALKGALMSAVNLCETLTWVVRNGGEAEETARLIGAAGVSIHIFGPDQALAAATLYPTTSAFGLSFGDRACLALGMTRNMAVLTADRAWKGLALDVEIVLIR